MKHEIITMGSAVIDAFIDTGISEIHKKMCYDVGTKISVNDLKFSTGGGGTNSAVAFSRLGMKTGFLGKLGKDANSQIILSELKKEKVDFIGKRGEQMTGYSVILDSIEHNRTVLTYKGANDFLALNEIKLKNLDSDWYYFSSMAGESHFTQEKLTKMLNKKGKKIAYNPSSYLTKKGVDYLKNILKNIFILILNNEEAENLTGNLSEIEMFKKLSGLGPEIVCITKGEKGNSSFYKGKIVKINANKVNVKEVTGAGDAFASGFVYGYIKFKNIEKAAKIGTINAE